MLSSNDGMLYDNFSIQYNGFSKNDEEWVDDEKCVLSILIPEDKGVNWYDEYIRLPDFCAGALSSMFLNSEWEVDDIDFTENQINKAQEVLKAINSHCINIILKYIENDDNTKIYNAARIVFTTD